MLWFLLVVLHLHNWTIVFSPALLWTTPISYYTSEEGNPDQNVTRMCWKWTAQFEQVIMWPCSFSLPGRRPTLSFVPCGYLHIRLRSFCGEESFGCWDWRREAQKGNISVSIQLPSVLEVMWIEICLYAFTGNFNFKILSEELFRLPNSNFVHYKIHEVFEVLLFFFLADIEYL